MTNSWGPILEVLKAPTRADEVEWRPLTQGINRNGKPWMHVAGYFNARAAMDRLDAAVGPGCWQQRLHQWQGGAVCELGIKDPDTGEWIWKSDGADPSNVDGFKGAISGALKRAVVSWGMGRDLYRLPSPTWAPDGSFDVWESGKKNDRPVYKGKITNEAAITARYIQGRAGDAERKETVPPTESRPAHSSDSDAAAMWRANMEGCHTEADLEDVAKALAQSGLNDDVLGPLRDFWKERLASIRAAAQDLMQDWTES